MTRPWPAYAAREAVLADLERAIAATPQALDTRFYYASFLRDHGRLDDAIATFAEILTVAPAHVDTLVAYAIVLGRRGRRLEARASLERAVAADGRHYAAAVNLANALSLDDPARAEALYRTALAIDERLAPAHRGLCSFYAARGDVAAAARHRAAGYASGPFGRRPYFGRTMPVEVLALVSTDGGMIPLETLLDPHRFLVHELFVEAYRDEPLPPCALIVNAIADADRGSAALARAATIVRDAALPVINDPLAVARTGRIANAARMQALPGIVAPDAWLVRDRPAPPAFPLIVRQPGLHMGRGMELVADASTYARVRESSARPADLIGIRYVETRSADGAWRKYRVMSIGGRLYPLHLAIADHWDVHYFSASMAQSDAFRREEEAFLRDPAAALGPRATAGLASVQDLLGLDYAGIDLALDAEQRAVIFEANAAMTVLPPDPGEHFRYRQPAYDRIMAAIAELLSSIKGAKDRR